MSLRKVENPELFRANIRSQLNKIIENDKCTLNLERGIFNYALNEAKSRKVVKKWDNQHFVQIYVDRLRSIFTNLKNKELLEKLQTGAVKPHIVAFMTHHEMLPDKWAELIKAKSIRDMNKFENNIEASTDLFTCPKCKSKRCTFMTAQLRSADEPCNIFYTCLDCNSRYKR